MTRPSASRSIFISGIESSSEPRSKRRRRRIIASSCIRPSSAWTSGVSFFFQASRSARYSSTSSYVNRRRLLIALLNTSVATRTPSARHLHHRRQGVADFVRLQAGQVVGDDLRQHRDDAIGQVDARRPVVGFAIERRFRLARSARRRRCGRRASSGRCRHRLERDGIVEIAGVDRVDRDDRLRR